MNKKNKKNNNERILDDILTINEKDVSKLDLRELCELEEQILILQKKRIIKGSDLNLYSDLMTGLSGLNKKLEEIRNNLKKYEITIDITKSLEIVDNYEIRFRSNEEELSLSNSKRLLYLERQLWKIISLLEKNRDDVERIFFSSPMGIIVKADTLSPLINPGIRILLERIMVKVIEDYPDFWGGVLLQYNSISDKLNMKNDSNYQDILDVKSHYLNKNFYEACNKISRIYEKVIRHYRSYIEFTDTTILNSLPKETLYNHIVFFKNDFLLSEMQEDRLNKMYEIRNITGHESKEFFISQENFIGCLTALLEMMLLIGFRLDDEINL